MKKVLSSVFFLAACGVQGDEYSPIDLSRLTNDKNHLYDAFEYIGLEEDKDYKEIKALVKVDPRQTEWCAAFVNAVLRESDIPTSASVSDHPLMAKSFLKWGFSVDTPRVGDVLVFRRNNSSWQGHVGFFIEDRGDTYVVFGGNQDDKVSFKEYKKSALLDIRRY